MLYFAQDMFDTTLGRVVFSGLYPGLVGLEAPPMRCLKHQKYGQVLIENMERSPIEYSLNKTTTYGILISKSGWRCLSFKGRAKLFRMLIPYDISLHKISFHLPPLGLAIF